MLEPKSATECCIRIYCAEISSLMHKSGLTFNNYTGADKSKINLNVNVSKKKQIHKPDVNK